jgi:hypothetical protein
LRSCWKGTTLRVSVLTINSAQTPAQIAFAQLSALAPLSLSHVAARLLVLPSHRRCLTAKRWHSARTHSAITPSATPARRDSEPPSYADVKEQARYFCPFAGARPGSAEIPHGPFVLASEHVIVLAFARDALRQQRSDGKCRAHLPPWSFFVVPGSSRSSPPTNRRVPDTQGPQLFMPPAVGRASFKHRAEPQAVRNL